MKYCTNVSLEKLIEFYFPGSIHLIQWQKVEWFEMKQMLPSLMAFRSPSIEYFSLCLLLTVPLIRANIQCQYSKYLKCSHQDSYGDIQDFLQVLPEVFFRHPHFWLSVLLLAFVEVESLKKIASSLTVFHFETSKWRGWLIRGKVALLHEISHAQKPFSTYC